MMHAVMGEEDVQPAAVAGEGVHPLLSRPLNTRRGRAQLGEGREGGDGSVNTGTDEWCQNITVLK